MKEIPFTYGSDIWPGLAKVTEECGELLQIIGKLQATGGDSQYWGGRNLIQELADELADAAAAIAWATENNFDNPDKDYMFKRFTRKVDLFHEWHESGDDPK